MNNQTLAPRRVPQVLVTLSPQGTLVAELPGANGARRKVPLTDAEAAQTLKRILNGQAQAHYEIGEDGAPTERQVRHWEKHQIWADDRCPFCAAEGRKEGSGRPRNPTITTHGSGEGAVTVRRVKVGVSGLKTFKTDLEAEDLGL